MRRRRGRTIISNNICKHYDSNEKFIFIKVLGYLYRIIDKFFFLDEEFSEIISLALGNDIEVIETFLLNIIKNKKTSLNNNCSNNNDDSFNEIVEDDLLIDRFGERISVIELLEKIDSKHLTHLFENFIKNYKIYATVPIR